MSDRVVTFTLDEFRANANVVFDAAEEHGRAAVIDERGAVVITIDLSGYAPEDE